MCILTTTTVHPCMGLNVSIYSTHTHTQYVYTALYVYMYIVLYVLSMKWGGGHWQRHWRTQAMERGKRGRGRNGERERERERPFCIMQMTHLSNARQNESDRTMVCAECTSDPCLNTLYSHFRLASTGNTLLISCCGSEDLLLVCTCTVFRLHHSDKVEQSLACEGV